MTERSIVIYHEVLDVPRGGWSVDRLVREATAIMTLVRAAAPAISTLHTLDAASFIWAANDRLAVGVALSPKMQLPLPLRSPRAAARKCELQDLVHADLAAIHASIAERQRQIDRLAARLRRAGDEITQRLQDRESELVDLILRAGGREITIRLPDATHSLYLPVLDRHRLDDHTIRLRALVSAIADTEARLSAVESAGEKPGHTLLGSLVLRPAEHAFREADRDLLASAWRSRVSMWFEVRLIRCTFTRKVVGASLVGIVANLPNGSG